MPEKYKEPLYSGKSEYLNLGISPGGVPVDNIAVPWEVTAHAFNMKIPDVWIAPEDLNDSELMDRIRSLHVLGCYVFAPLEDLGFIAGFGEVMDIYIADGSGLKDLSFLSGLGEWMMLHIHGARLKDLEPVYLSSLNGRTCPVFCLSFSGCRIDDASALYGMKNISELIVAGDGSEDDKKVWERVQALTYRCYTSKKGDLK